MVTIDHIKPHETSVVVNITPLCVKEKTVVIFGANASLFQL